MNAIAQAANQIIDIEVERDRKICVSLDLKATGANRELAQWLLDHPTYSAPVVAGWLGCGAARIKKLRIWAKEGFIGSAYTAKYKKKIDSSNRNDQQLKSLDNLDYGGQEAEISGGEDTEIADPDVIEDNALYTLQRINENVRVFKKLFKASPLDLEARNRISVAIERTIQKLRSTQAILERKGNDEQA